MDRGDISDRIVEQFSEGSDRADIWLAFDLFLPTDEFLNMGYSRWYQTHLLGSPQLRLVERVIEELSSMNACWTAGRLLDVGCGRGGAVRHLTDTYGATVVGIDLVPYNVATARAQMSDGVSAPSFVVGDAACMPFDRNAFPACVAIDSLVYVPDKRGVFDELSRVLEPEGVCVVSDLLVSAETDVDDRVVRRFCNAWDMPPLWTLDTYRDAIEAAGLTPTIATDLTSHSVKRFRKWTSLFLLVADGPFGHVLEELLTYRGLHPETIIDQVRAAHDALPAFRHVLVALRADGVDQRPEDPATR